MRRQTSSYTIQIASVRSSRQRRKVPQLARHSLQKNSAPVRVRLIVLVTYLVLIGATAPIWLPAVRGVVPDRYIVAYAPAWLQPLIFRIDVSDQVPAPARGASNIDAEELLVALAPTPSPTALPTDETSRPIQYLQPTPVAVAPTATLTPVYSKAINPGAADRQNEADLNEITFLLEGFTWEQQGYNNCGPASLKVLMSYWGIEFTEEEAASYLKPNPEDPNVRPDEMAAYTEQQGYNMLIRVDGDLNLLKQLILAGYPVLIEAGYDPEPDTLGWTSHYLPLVGFSDDGFIAMDTYRRPNWLYPYDEIDYYWRQFNRRYLVAYRDDQAAAIASIIGDEMNDAVMYQHALQTARLEIDLDQSDPYAWFNLGSTLVALNQPGQAATGFDKARELGLPWRFLWYQFTPFEAYVRVGRYDDVLKLAEAVLERKDSEEPHYYAGLAYAGLGDIDASRRHLTDALRFNRNYEVAQIALDGLKD